jgi:hypothetical protein
MPLLLFPYVQTVLKPSIFFTFPPGLTFKNCKWCSLCVECFVEIGFYNCGGKYLERGTDWCLIKSRLGFVLKRSNKEFLLKNLTKVFYFLDQFIPGDVKFLSNEFLLQILSFCGVLICTVLIVGYKQSPTLAFTYMPLAKQKISYWVNSPSYVSNLAQSQWMSSNLFHRRQQIRLTLILLCRTDSQLLCCVYRN